MSNYDDKLAEWLKYVQQQQVDAAKTTEEEKPPEPQRPKAKAEPATPIDVPGDVVIRDRLGRTFLSDTSDMDTDRIIGDYSRIQDSPRPEDLGPALFDEDEIPNVEDYLPFLKEQPEDVSMPPPPEPPSPHQRLIDFTEGTGEPKPASRQPETEARAYPAPSQPASAAPQVQQVSPVILPEPRPAAPAPAKKPQAKPKQKRVRSKIAIESRDEMIARLLDPVISLEEAARILDVCPTTVRRYTNRGVLKHHRTGGNQRRFRLSNVLAFLQASSRGEIDLEGENEK